jgi:mono/diheme cytochrome c family protein
MGSSRLRILLIAAGILVLLLAVASPSIVATYWRVRSSNPVRRGVSHARELGCFSCHGPAGTRGVPEPGREESVPGWGGGVWMMYVETEDDVRRIIRDGSIRHEDESEGTEAKAISMPAYGDVVSPAELDDLVAAFKALAGMVKPGTGTAARTGQELARKWQCFACHGPAGSGGLPNPASFTGFIPGWYGADFEDLVRNREEFDSWILEGSIARLSENPIASYFMERQRLGMPAYRDLTRDELDALWAYFRWLEETDGGHAGDIASW